MIDKQIQLIRSQIADAISWNLIYQIMRRYQAKYKLRVFETHPGGGQYDCISIYAIDTIQQTSLALFDFNLQAQSLHVWNDINGKLLLERYDIIDDYLSAKTPVDILNTICRKAKFGIPAKLPPSTESVIATGVMSSLLQINMFSPVHLKYLMGYIDTSGYGGGLRPQFDLFKATQNLLQSENIKQAYRYFFLVDTKNTNDAKCLFDMQGKIYFRDDSEMDLLSAYNVNNHNISLLTAQIATRI